jgi:hypothetical protein
MTYSENVMDEFIKLVEKGEVKYVLMNRLGEFHTLTFGTYGKDDSQTFELRGYPAVRNKLYQFLLKGDFEHLSLIYQKFQR